LVLAYFLATLYM